MKIDYVLLSLELDDEKRVFANKHGRKKSLARKKLKLRNLLKSAEQVNKNLSITMTCCKNLSYQLVDKNLAVFSGTLKGKYIVEVYPSYVNILFM